MQQFPIYANVVVLKISFAAKLGHDLPVHEPILT